MSIDPSLKVKNALTRHRNVLTRDERIAKLKDEEKWTEQDSVFGLLKVAHRKSHAGKKEKVEGEGEAAAATTEAGAAAPAAATGKAAPAAKAAAPKAAPGKAEKAEKPGKEKKK